MPKNKLGTFHMTKDFDRDIMKRIRRDKSIKSRAAFIRAFLEIYLEKGMPGEDLLEHLRREF